MRAIQLKLKISMKIYPLSQDNILKYDGLIIYSDFNAHLGIQYCFKLTLTNEFALHEDSNRNGIMLKYYILKHNLLCLNILYQKIKYQLWTHTSPNGNKVQLDYIMIHTKRKYNNKNYRAF